MTVAVRELLSDEIDHGRIGWALLATLGPRVRERINPWLLPLVQANLAEWGRVAQDSRPALVAQGLASRDLVQRAPREALDALILPGLDALGFETEPIRSWLVGASPGPV